MRAVLIMVLAGSVLLLTGCGNTSTPENVVVPTLAYGLVADPATFDPHQTNSAEVGVVLRQVYDTLIYRHPTTLDFVPGLAESWTISEDGLTYTFTLKQGVLFHDNTPFNAQAVAANMDRILRIGQGSQAYDLLEKFGSYEIIDDYTLILRLTEPDAAFLDSLSQFYLGIASPTALETFSDLRYQFYQAGTGPYRFVDFIPGSYVVLERNQVYGWGPLFYEPPMIGRIDRIEFRYHIQPEVRGDILVNQDVSIISQLPPNTARSLAVNPQIQIVPLVEPGQPRQFVMNTIEFPTDNLLVRQALIQATNRPELVNTVAQGFANPAYSPLSPTTLFHNTNFTGAYPYDLLAARDLITTAGFGDSDNDGIFDVDGVPLQVRMLVRRDEVSLAIVERLRIQWREAGIDTVILIAPTQATLLNLLETETYNLVATEALAVEPTFLADSFVTGGVSNWTNYEEDGLTETLTLATSTMDIVERATRYVAAQQTIMEEALILPIFDDVNLIGASSAVGNIQFHANKLYPILPNMTYTP
jgi:peptide/nickel transport system substrate-binding protein